MVMYALWYLVGGLITMILAVLRNGGHWDPRCDVIEAAIYIAFWPFILLAVVMMFIASAIADFLRFVWQ